MFKLLLLPGTDIHKLLAFGLPVGAAAQAKEEDRSREDRLRDIILNASEDSIKNMAEAGVKFFCQTVDAKKGPVTLITPPGFLTMTVSMNNEVKGVGIRKSFLAKGPAAGPTGRGCTKSSNFGKACPISADYRSSILDLLELHRSTRITVPDHLPNPRRFPSLASGSTDSATITGGQDQVAQPGSALAAPLPNGVLPAPPPGDQVEVKLELQTAEQSEVAQAPSQAGDTPSAADAPGDNEDGAADGAEEDRKPDEAHRGDEVVP